MVNESTEKTQTSVICPACRSYIPEGSKTCPNCGKSLIKKPMISSNGVKIFTWVLFALLFIVGIIIGVSGVYMYDADSYFNDGYVWSFNYVGMIYLWGAAIIEVFIGAVFSSILYHLERIK